MNKCIITLSGKKQSGKSSAVKFILAEHINRKIGKDRFFLEKSNKEVYLIDSFNNNKIVNVDFPSEEVETLFKTYSAKIYSFADPLKQFCIDVFGLSPVQCYGTDDDKNTQTHLNWEDFPAEIREKHSRPRRGSGGIKAASGLITGRELLQTFGTDVCRKIDPNCFARGTYNIIKKEGYDLAIVSDARFPNEVTIGTEIGAKVVRLTRNVLQDTHESEISLDSDKFPIAEFSLVIDNQDKTMEETHKIIKSNILQWFRDAKL